MIYKDIDKFRNYCKYLSLLTDCHYTAIEDKVIKLYRERDKDTLNKIVLFLEALLDNEDVKTVHLLFPKTENLSLEEIKSEFIQYVTSNKRSSIECNVFYESR